MTFIPSVLTNSDLNNTTTNTTGTSYIGTGTITTGYNTVYMTLTSTLDSAAGGLEIQFSANNSTWITYYTDTYFTGTLFSKSYTILGKYWRVTYATSSATFTINSRLSTNVDPTAQGIDSFYINVSDPYHDAFGKLRTTTPYTLIDNKFPFADTGTATPEFLSNTREDCNLKVEPIGSTVTAVFGSSQCVITITTAAAVPASYTSQSRKYATYQPGKSLLFLSSGIIKDTTTTSTNYTARIGYFDDNNGLFFEQNYSATPGENIGVVLRNNIVDTRITQNNWNIDKFNGTGISGVNLNFQKNQLFVIDFEWLSAGRIRFGFYLFGRIFYCHQITNLNSLTGPYMDTPNLPVRYQLTVNDSNKTAKLTQICSSVMSEGGYNPVGKPFSISNGIAPISVTQTETALLAIRGNSAAASSTNNRYYHQNIVPTLLNVFSTANNDIFYEIRLYLAPNTPTVTTWTAVDVNSVVQYALGAAITAITPVSNGVSIVVDTGYAAGRGGPVISVLESIYSNTLQITSDVSNVSDVILITAKKVATGSGIPVYASISWQEVY
jgi:hypothetical protein